MGDGLASHRGCNANDRLFVNSESDGVRLDEEEGKEESNKGNEDGERAGAGPSAGGGGGLVHSRSMLPWFGTVTVSLYAEQSEEMETWLMGRVRKRVWGPARALQSLLWGSGE